MLKNKLGNKGFAVTSVLYTLLVAFLLFLGAALAEFSTATKLLSKANEDLTDADRILSSGSESDPSSGGGGSSSGGGGSSSGGGGSSFGGILSNPNDISNVFNNINIRREEIETIEFKSTIDVPENIPESNIWDASLNKDNSVMAYYTDDLSTGLRKLVISSHGKIQFPENSKSLFQSYIKLNSINFNDSIYTLNVTNMEDMFIFCEELRILDLSAFDTSNVENMSYMFRFLYKLEDLNLSSFDFENVDSFGYMFDDQPNENIKLKVNDNGKKFIIDNFNRYKDYLEITG